MEIYTHTLFRFSIIFHQSWLQIARRCAQYDYWLHRAHNCKRRTSNKNNNFVSVCVLCSSARVWVCLDRKSKYIYYLIISIFSTGFCVNNGDRDRTANDNVYCLDGIAIELNSLFYLFIYVFLVVADDLVLLDDSVWPLHGLRKRLCDGLCCYC